jgi:hypothetical protein
MARVCKLSAARSHMVACELRLYPGVQVDTHRWYRAHGRGQWKLPAELEAQGHAATSLDVHHVALSSAALRSLDVGEPSRTGVGTFWLWESKRLSAQCLPMGMPLVFIVTWQALSYAWILIHATLGGVAWILERRVRTTEASLRSMEDSDTLARWGQVSMLPGYTALANNSLGGLSPDQIHELPEMPAAEAKLGEDSECSICLNDICQDDTVRLLSSCGHSFHRSCIDLWLLRRADCPLCKQSVSACAHTTATHAKTKRSRSPGASNQWRV